MALSAEWQFIFAVFLMYGFLFTMYTYSNGAAFGLPTAGAFAPSAPATAGFTDWLTGGISVMIGFFTVMFIQPLAGFWWLTAINWAILGTTAYIFFRMIRGGG